jgi:predicted peptidase
MQTRRTMLVTGLAATGVMLGWGPKAMAGEVEVKSATAITRVYGNGMRFIAVAVHLAGEVAVGKLSIDDFKVGDRTIVAVYPASAADPAARADTGSIVIIELSDADAGAKLLVEPERSSPPAGAPQGGGKPRWKAGDPNVSDSSWATPQSKVAAVDVATGVSAKLAAATVDISAVRNLVVDDFQQRVWIDPETGRTLPYNLLVPKDYDASRSYPLVNFMHDAGATSDDTLFTLRQGLGAIAFAGPEDQAKRPCFVLAPQYAEIIADDGNNTSTMLDTTINLIKALAKEFNIDTRRLYTTGQSGGGMLSIAMNVKYPDFFAASFLVACQWGAHLVAPMANNLLFIVTSQDDFGAFPGQNAVTAALEDAGATISRAIWDGTWSAEQFRFAFDDLDAEAARINYVSFAAGTVIPEGETTAGASGHRNTWRVAYTIEPIREWLFRQSRPT